MKRTWYFIDIDGCIMPNIFNNQFYKNDKEKLEVIANVYQKVVNEKIQLYPQFIQWFRQNLNNNIIQFITGRQYNIFGYLTTYQLFPLREISPTFRPTLYYPDDLKHTWNNYLKFKIKTIYNIIKTHDCEGDYIHIYDDFDLSKELKILEMILDIKIEFHLITKPEDWEKL